MKKGLSISSIEKDMFSTRLSDGFIDFILSSLLLQFSLAVFLSRNGYDGFFGYIFLSLISLLMIFLAFIIRKYVTEPLMGNVKFSKKRVNRVNTFFVVAVIILVCVVVFMIFSASLSLFSNKLLQLLIFPLIFLIIFSGFGYVMNLRRLYIYGIASLFLIFVGALLDQLLSSIWLYPIAILLISLIMLTVSVILLINFVKQNRNDVKG